MQKIVLIENLENLPQAAALRQRVFIQEQGFVEEFDDTDRTACHVAILEDDEAVATGRTFCAQEDTWVIGRVAVDADRRGCHLGQRVIYLLEGFLRGQGVKNCRLSAQCHAQGFYAKLGYMPQGEVYFEEHVPHITMTKTL